MVIIDEDKTQTQTHKGDTQHRTSINFEMVILTNLKSQKQREYKQFLEHQDPRPVFQVFSPSPKQNA